MSTYEYLPTCLLTVGTLTHVPTTYPLASFLTLPSATQGARHVGAHVPLRDHGAALGLGQDPRPVLHVQGHPLATVEPYRQSPLPLTLTLNLIPTLTPNPNPNSNPNPTPNP